MTEPVSPAGQALARFWEDAYARWAVRVVAVFILLAIYAPFLASDVALVWVDEAGWRLPALADLVNQWNHPKYHDLLFNVTAVLLPLLWLAGFALRRWWSTRTRWVAGAGVVVAAWLLAMAPVLPGINGGEARSLWRKYPPAGTTVSDAADRRAALDEWNKTPATERGERPDPPPSFALFPPISHRQDLTYAGGILLAPGTMNPVTGQRFWLGTDTVGHDVAARMLSGSRISLTVGLLATSLALVIGLLIGAIAGTCGGFIDVILSRIIEIMMCFPTFILVLVVVAALGRDLYVIMAVIGLTSWAGTARLMRGEFLALSVRDHTLAAIALGVPRWRIILVHLLPNALTPLLITASFGVAGAVGAEAGLSFLGLGDPAAASWGSLLEQGRTQIHYAWLIWVPGLAVFLLVALLNLIGNALREAFDVRSH